VSITDEIQPAEKRLFRYSRAQTQRDETRQPRRKASPRRFTSTKVTVSRDSQD